MSSVCQTPPPPRPKATRSEHLLNLPSFPQRQNRNIQQRRPHPHTLPTTRPLPNPKSDRVCSDPPPRSSDPPPMDASSRRIPYRQLGEAELELVTVGSGDPDRDLGTPNGLPVSSSSPVDSEGRVGGSGLKTLILGSLVAAGVQFGWALQLSLLTPYIQTLGVGHAFSSFIWICGPITGFVVQPCVGIWSDNCHSKYGRRRPFILVGSLMISVAVIVIGFAADVGYFLGDTREHCSTYKGPRWRAAGVFIIGFWLLDLANNTVQGPARALLADISGKNQVNAANAIFCSWMALGNILGYSAGANGQWHSWFPFLTTKACCKACGNLKAAFLIAIVFLMFCTIITLYFAKEIPLTAKSATGLSDSSPLLKEPHPEDNEHFSLDSGKSDINEIKETNLHINGKYTTEVDHNSNLKEEHSEAFDTPSAVLVNILTSLRHLPPGMHAVLLVMALTWAAWFPFILFDTDWMGREVYHGNPKGSGTDLDQYDRGVRQGAFGLLLNSVVLLFSSFFVEPACKKMGARMVWGLSNFIIFACMLATTIISLLSHKGGQSYGIEIASLVLFAVLGIPLSITYSVPFSMTAELTAGTGGGQGLATGVLNLAIVVPQMVVSIGAGPWDAMFGGGNIPAFVLAAIFALVSGIIAIMRLPRISFRSSGFHGYG